ncbi:MAG: zinc-ribbon domain-containing protein [Ruminococcus sp.]|nr:zinc-ribbon domain-containing protein [Ruminococcus sp.]
MMICPSCGAEIESGFSFCVRCGSKLDIPASDNALGDEPDYGKADMGGYHTEEEFPEGHGGFTMGSGTFIISDRPSPTAASDIYTADELNDSDEDFDFSQFDFSEGKSSPQTAAAAPELPPVQEPSYPAAPALPPDTVQPGMQGFPQNQPVYPGQQPYPGYQQGYAQQFAGYQQPYQQFPGTQQGQPVYPGVQSQPQIIGYDPSGTPIYGQPQMFQGMQVQPQPQIIGYDPSGMPIYGQPQMYQPVQPQIIGYDPTGMPIYGQPQMYQPVQPQIIGYDPAGMPIYGQMPMQDMSMQGFMGGTGMPGMQNMSAPAQSHIPEPEPEPEPESPAAPSDADEFWAFFDGGKAKKHEAAEDIDFFDRSAKNGMSDLSAAGLDTSGLRRAERKKNSYMTDTPLVDANDLAPNDADKFNKFYMRQTELVSADDLQANTTKKQADLMGVTADVDVDRLSANEHYRSRITMYSAGEANADDLESYVHKPIASMMKGADHAVEAMPKKKKYVDPTDLVELPEYMKARKTERQDTTEIPSIPGVDTSGFDGGFAGIE